MEKKEQLEMLFKKLEKCVIKFYEEYYKHRFYITTDDDVVNFWMSESIFPYMIGVKINNYRNLMNNNEKANSVLLKMIKNKDEFIQKCLDDSFFCTRLFSEHASENMDMFLELPPLCLKYIDCIAKPCAGCMIVCLKKGDVESHLFLMAEEKVGTYYVARALLNSKNKHEYYYASKKLQPTSITHGVKDTLIHETKGHILSKKKDDFGNR